MPDLTGLNGWMTAWNLLPNVQTNVAFTAVGGSISIILDGSVARTATVTEVRNFAPAG